MDGCEVQKTGVTKTGFLRRHHWKQEKCPLNRGVLLIEIIITNIICLLAGTRKRFPINGGVSK